VIGVQAPLGQQLLDVAQTEESRRSIQAAYHGVTAKLQHFLYSPSALRQHLLNHQCVHVHETHLKRVQGLGDPKQTDQGGAAANRVVC